MAKPPPKITLGQFMKNAVILDKKPGIREMIQNIIKAQGVDVLKSTSRGEDALEVIRDISKNCDFIITGLDLADINGIQLVHATRALNHMRNAHILVIYEEMHTPNLFKLVDYGLSGFFKLPLTGHEFETFLQGMLINFLRMTRVHEFLHTLTAAQFFENQKKFDQALYKYDVINEKIGDARSFFDVMRMYTFLENVDQAKEYLDKIDSSDSPTLQKEVAVFVSSHLVEAMGSKEIPYECLNQLGRPRDMSDGKFYKCEELSRILVASGSLAERTAIKSTFADLNIKSEATNTGEAVIEKFNQAEDIDLFILTIELDDMNALQLLDYLHKNVDKIRRTHIVLATEKRFLPSIETAFSLGLDGVFFKPYSANTVRDALHTILLFNDLLIRSGKSRKPLKGAFHLAMLEAPEPALKFATDAMDIDSEDAVTHFVMGVVMHFIRGGGRAGGNYRRACELYPALEPVVDRYRDKISSRIQDMDIKDRPKIVTPPADPEEELVEVGDFDLEEAAPPPDPGAMDLKVEEAKTEKPVAKELKKEVKGTSPLQTGQFDMDIKAQIVAPLEAAPNPNLQILSTDSKVVSDKELIPSAKSFLAEKDFSSAVHLLSQAHKKNPKDCTIMETMGKTLVKSKNFKDAILWLKAVLKRDPNRIDSYNMLGICYKKLKKYDKAIKWYERGLHYFPKSAKLYHNLAIVYATINDSVKAEETLRKAKKFYGIDKAS